MKMKRNKTIKSNRISADLEHRLTKVEDATKTLSDEVKTLGTETKENFTVISTSLDKTNKDLQVLLDRKQEKEAVKTFCTNFLKVSAAILGIVSSLATMIWAITQIINFFRNH